MSNSIKVVKRSGSTEPIDLNKLHVMVDSACEGLAGVSASQVEIQSGIQFYDGMTTKEIQEVTRLPIYLNRLCTLVTQFFELYRFRNLYAGLCTATTYDHWND